MSIEWPLIITPTFLGSIPNFGVRFPKQLTVSPKIGEKVVTIVSPPICLVIAVLFHMQVCKAKSTLIVPEWKKAPFWPLLYNPARPDMFPDFMKDYFYLPKSRDMFYGSDLFSNNKSAFSGTPKLNVLALKGDFSSSFGVFLHSVP